MSDEPSAEGLAAMALSNSLLAVVIKKGLLSRSEAVRLLDRAQFHLEDQMSAHPGREKAVRILESILRGIENPPPEAKP